MYDDERMKQASDLGRLIGFAQSIRDMPQVPDYARNWAADILNELQSDLAVYISK